MKSQPMTRPRFRFSLRTMLVVVGIAALMSWQLARSPALSAQVERHVRLANVVFRAQCKAPSQDDLEKWDQVVRYHDALCDKYDRALWQPWLLIEPDGPAPEYESRLTQLADRP